MVADGVQQQESASGMDLPAHRRNYEGFLKVLRRSAIAVAIVTAIVLVIISR
jgi:hypothetical protein